MTANPTIETPFPRLSWGAKAMILAGGPSVGLAMAGVSVVLPKIEAALAHGPEDKLLVKMLAGAVGVAMIIGAPVTGFLADRVGLRFVLFLNYLLFTVAGTAGMYLNDLPLFVASRFLLGLGAAGTLTASITIINRRLAPTQRAGWMGLYSAGTHLTGLILYPLSGMLAELNWHYAFGIYLFGAPFAIIALTAFEAGADVHTQTEGPKEPRGARSEKEPGLLSWFPFRYASLALLGSFISSSATIYAPFYFRLLGIGPAKASFIMIGTSIVAMISSVIFIKTRRYLSKKAIFVVALATQAVAPLLVLTAHDSVFVAIGMAVSGWGIGWYTPNLLVALGSSVKSEQQGRAAGIVKSATFAGMPICILVLEGPAQLYGPAFPLMFSGVLSLAMMLFFMFKIAAHRGAVPA